MQSMWNEELNENGRWFSWKQQQPRILKILPEFSMTGGEIRNNFPTEAIIIAGETPSGTKAFLGCRRARECNQYIEPYEDTEIPFEFIEKLYFEMKESKKIAQEKRLQFLEEKNKEEKWKD